MNLYKVLDENGRAMHGGTGKWKINKWMPEIADIKPCVRGYHLCRGLPETDLLYWLGPKIHPVLYISGDRVDAGDKIVVSRAKIGPPLETWNDCTARLFAADCAEWAVKRFWRPKKLGLDREHRAAPQKSIEAARQYAHGEISEAARAAAEAAAWAAAGEAVWAAGAAGAAARRWQARRLGKYLSGALD